MPVSNSAIAKDSNARSLVKAISWRLVAFVVLSIITYLFTGTIKVTGYIAIAYNVIQIGVYFGHERVWDRIGWGRPSAVDILPPSAEVSESELEVIVERLRDLGYIE